MQGTSLFDALMAQCRDLVSGRLEIAIAGMFDKSDAALAELATKTQDRERQKLYLAAKDAARTQREAMQKSYRMRYLGEFNQRSNRARKIGGSFSDADFSSLVLMADDDLNETLQFNELAARMRRNCDEEINALDQRVGVLLGDADLPSEDNPFSAQAICDAYKHTCRQAIEGPEVRSIFVKLFDDHVLDSVRAIYKEVNELLVQNSILPKIRYAVTRQEAGKAAAKEARGEGEKPETASQDIFAMLQKMMASNAGGPGQGGGGGSGVGGQPLMQGAELLGSLTQLQLDGLAALGAGATLPSGEAVTGTTNILHELKSSNVGASMGRMDAMTLDIVARIFDQLFDDPKIPLGVKGLIGRLQIPMLKVAIADKEFFSKKEHPARLLLDTLGEIAIRLPADFNTQSALFGHLETILQELITGFKDEVDIFDIVREQLLALMTREDERIEQESRAAAERVEQEEALSVAKGVAQQEVSARVQAYPLPGPVLEFLIEQWLKLMMIIHVKRGAASTAWKNALEAMDQLIWSVQPKETLEDRRKLAALVPPLLKRIAAGLKAADIEDEIREHFFADLMNCHTKIMMVAAKGAAAAPGAAAPASIPSALDFTPSITMKNPFGAGNVQVSEAELSAADTPRYGRGARGANYPDDLKQGDWMEFKIKTAEGAEDERRPARLIFISPRKTRYIFSDRSEKDYIECTRSEITRRFRSGEAVFMEEVPEVPFFERIMKGVVGKMSGPAAAA